MNVIPRDQHCISRQNISDNALKVLSRLRKSGHEAYLVGGAVRDLLLGGRPKDFDIATDATPEAVRELFRNGRIIGRRFKIVHVRFGREIIEVTTFRGHHDEEQGSDARADAGSHSRQSASGLLLRDNVYGTLEEDAVRRDLTVNALYYDAGTFEVIDYVGGMEDLAAARARVIGEPRQRYTEDPVRMLRVLRFAAKLAFSIERDTADAITECAHLLGEIPPARLFDEFLKLFLAGNAQPTLDKLVEFDLLRYLFPQASEHLAREPTALALARAAMRSTDQRIAADQPVTPAFILAALLWPSVRELAAQQEDRGEPRFAALHSAAQLVLMEAVQHIAIPRRFTQPMRDIWELQLRLENRRGRRTAELVEHRRFRAAYDFLLLREEAGDAEAGSGDWWTRFQQLDREARLREAGAAGGGSRHGDARERDAREGDARRGDARRGKSRRRRVRSAS